MHSEWLSESTENASQDVPNEADVVIIGGGSLGCQVSFDKRSFFLHFKIFFCTKFLKLFKKYKYFLLTHINCVQII